MTRPLRVLHCLHDVGGNAVTLAAAERSIGLESVAVTLRLQAYAYEGYEVLCGLDTSFGRQEVERGKLLLRALRHFDVIHFNFGRTIAPPWRGAGSARGRGLPRVLEPLTELYLRALWMRDLPVLSLAHKAIFITYQGDDVRQGDVLARQDEVSHVHDVGPGYYTATEDRSKRLGVRRVDRYADQIFALNPDLLRFLPARARFLPYANVDLDRWRPVEGTAGDEIVVVHAPTHRLVKGTGYILDAVEQLQREGLPIRLELVEGRTHAEAHQLYAQADLLIDQVLCGWYGGLAVELMAMGKPVVAYLRERDLRTLPPGMAADLPVVSAEPSNLVDVLRDLLSGGREGLRRRGEESRRFVEKWHDPRTIATQLRGDYERAVSDRRSPRVR